MFHPIINDNNNDNNEKWRVKQPWNIARSETLRSYHSSTNEKIIRRAELEVQLTTRLIFDSSVAQWRKKKQSQFAFARISTRNDATPYVCPSIVMIRNRELRESSIAALSTFLAPDRPGFPGLPGETRRCPHRWNRDSKTSSYLATSIGHLRPLVIRPPCRTFPRSKDESNRGRVSF